MFWWSFWTTIQGDTSEVVANIPLTSKRQFLFLSGLYWLGLSKAELLLWEGRHNLICLPIEYNLVQNCAISAKFLSASLIWPHGLTSCEYWVTLLLPISSPAWTRRSRSTLRSWRWRSASETGTQFNGKSWSLWKKLLEKCHFYSFTCHNCSILCSFVVLQVSRNGECLDTKTTAFIFMYLCCIFSWYLYLK